MKRLFLFLAFVVAFGAAALSFGCHQYPPYAYDYYDGRGRYRDYDDYDRGYRKGDRWDHDKHHKHGKRNKDRHKHHHGYYD